MLSEAIRSFERIGDLPHALGHMGNVCARDGENGTALSIAEKLKRHVEQSGIGRYEIALIYAGLPQNDNAFDWLEKALRVRDKGVTYIRIDPCIDPLRSDPHLQDLERQVGFPNQ